MGKKRRQSVKKRSSGDGKQGNLKKRKQVLMRKMMRGNVKKEKRILSGEVNGEGKGWKKEEVCEEANEFREWKESSMKKQKAVEGEQGSDDLWNKYPHLRSSLLAKDLPKDVKERAMMMSGKVPEEKLEREWRSLMNAKLEFFMMEKDLIEKQMKLALDG